MPDFVYTARDMSGQRVSGTIVAASQREAVNMLAGQSLFPLEVTVPQQTSSFGMGRRVSGQVVATVYSQLAGLLRSGVPLLRSIRVLRDQSSNLTLKQALSDVHER